MCWLPGVSAVTCSTLDHSIMQHVCVQDLLAQQQADRAEAQAAGPVRPMKRLTVRSRLGYQHWKQKPTL